MGCRPRARSALHCHGVLALRDRPLSGALLAVQEGGRMEGLRLVSRQFRKHRWAVWAAGRGPDPHFTAMICHCILALRDRPLSGALMAVQEGGRMEGLRLVSRQFRSDVWQYGLPAAGRIRTSLLWCFGSARPSFERSFDGSAGRRANGRSETSF